MKGTYKNNRDLSVASQHWTKESRAVPGREQHCPLRGDGDCPIKCDAMDGILSLFVVLARLDASGELKRVPLTLAVWPDCGKLGQLGKTRCWYLQHTTHWTRYNQRHVREDFHASSEYKTYLKSGGESILMERHRCARPYTTAYQLVPTSTHAPCIPR